MNLPLVRGRFAGAALFVLVLAAAGAVAAFGAPAWVRIPIVKPHGPNDPQAASMFSHPAHGQYQCSACHPSVFPQARRGFTHDDIDEGKFCGACHDNKIAFSIDNPDVRCGACHHK